MKIKLIAPHEQSEDNISSVQTFKVQKVNLPLLAALTPPEHSVRIVDEVFAPDDVNEEVDLVGITVMTDHALRAYQIAGRVSSAPLPVCAIRSWNRSSPDTTCNW